MGRGGAIALPARLTLPSGRVVALSTQAARRAGEGVDPSATAERPFERALRVLAAPGVLSSEGGAPISVEDLALGDANTLRAVLYRAGLLREPRGRFVCDNCDAPIRASPSASWEWGPFIDGELDDPELDRPFAFDADHDVAPIRVRGRWVHTARLAPRTVGESALLRGGGPARITPAFVVAMGVVRLGSERRATVLAEALAEASDEAWYSLVDLFLVAHYPPRLVAYVRCEGCGANQPLDVPLERELDRGPRRVAAPAREVDLDTFEAMVRTAAEEVYERRRVQNIGLYVDGGVPQCDDGGVPLYGCYTPGGEDPDLGIPQPPEIRIFYRTFVAELRARPGFDLRAEIHETIDHEVTHHLHFLSGHDPLDDEERAEIVEEERRVIGRTEHRRRAFGALIEEIGGFARVAWPFLLIGFLAALLSRWN